MFKKRSPEARQPRRRETPTAEPAPRRDDVHKGESQPKPVELTDLTKVTGGYALPRVGGWR